MSRKWCAISDGRASKPTGLSAAYPRCITLSTALWTLKVRSWSGVGVVSDCRELKHQTFLFHVRQGWPRRTGSGTRFTRQMQIMKQTNVKPSPTQTEYFSWKCLSKILPRFWRSNLTKERTRIGNCYIGYQILTILTVFILTFLNLWFQPENSRFEIRDCSPRTSWHAQWLSCCKNTSGWRPWYQERLVFKFATICRRPTKKTETNLKADEEKQ